MCALESAPPSLGTYHDVSGLQAGSDCSELSRHRPGGPGLLLAWVPYDVVAGLSRRGRDEDDDTARADPWNSHHRSTCRIHFGGEHQRGSWIS